MKKVLQLLGVLVVLFAFSGTPALAGPPAGKQLTATEIKNMLIGKTARYNTKKGNRLSVFWKEDGTMSGQYESATSRGATPGTWKITDDGQLCSSWSSARLESGCRTLFVNEKAGEIQSYNAEGTPVSTITEILPGNPGNL